MPRVQINYAGTEYEFRSLYSDDQAIKELKDYIARGRVWSKKAKALAEQDSLSDDDMKLVRFFIHRSDTYVGPEQTRLFHRPTGGNARIVRRFG